MMNRDDFENERNVMLQILKQTDYIALKIAEGAATPEEYEEQLALRQSCRTRINEIDEQLEDI